MGSSRAFLTMPPANSTKPNHEEKIRHQAKDPRTGGPSRFFGDKIERHQEKIPEKNPIDTPNQIGYIPIQLYGRLG